MKSILVLLGMAMCFVVIISFGAVSLHAEQPGEALFKKNCEACHMNGGNIISPQKTLHKKSLEARKIKSADDIVRVMRNPGPGMSKFDEKTIPDKQARQIADYILKTF